MASKRRGFRAPELRGTLGTLLRTTTDAVRGALERGAREGRARLDSARAGRRRHDALADLGEIVLDLIRRGEIDLAELPEARNILRELDELDADSEDSEDSGDEAPRPAERSRFDDRRPTGRSQLPGDDGTVSSGASRAARPTVYDRPRSRPASPTHGPTPPIKGMWRPAVDDAEEIPERPARGTAERVARETERGHTGTRRDADRASPSPVAVTADIRRRPPTDEPDHRRAEPKRSPTPRDPDRKGGISFDDDDLHDYMHPDDVPPKTPPSEPGDGEA